MKEKEGRPNVSLSNCWISCDAAHPVLCAADFMPPHKDLAIVLAIQDAHCRTFLDQIGTQQLCHLSELLVRL